MFPTLFYTEQIDQSVFEIALRATANVNLKPSNRISTSSLLIMILKHRQWTWTISQLTLFRKSLRTIPNCDIQGDSGETIVSLLAKCPLGTKAETLSREMTRFIVCKSVCFCLFFCFFLTI